VIEDFKEQCSFNSEQDLNVERGSDLDFLPSALKKHLSTIVEENLQEVY